MNGRSRPPMPAGFLQGDFLRRQATSGVFSSLDAAASAAAGNGCHRRSRLLNLFIFEKKLPVEEAAAAVAAARLSLIAFISSAAAAASLPIVTASHLPRTSATSPQDKISSCRRRHRANKGRKSRLCSAPLRRFFATSQKAALLRRIWYSSTTHRCRCRSSEVETNAYVCAESVYTNMFFTKEGGSVQYVQRRLPSSSSRRPFTVALWHGNWRRITQQAMLQSLLSRAKLLLLLHSLTHAAAAAAAAESDLGLLDCRQISCRRRRR